MNFKHASLFAALFGSALAFDANADGRIVLTSTELDDVTAVPRYTPEQVGELREVTDEATSELDRLRPEVVPNTNHDVGKDPARPVSADHTMPAMAATRTPATPAPAVTTPSLPAVTSAPPTPTRHASVSPSLSDAHGSTARQPSISTIRHQEGTPVMRASTSEAVARAAIRSSVSTIRRQEGTPVARASTSGAVARAAIRSPISTIRRQEGNPVTRASTSGAVARAAIRSSPPDQPGARELAVMRRPEPALRDTIRQVQSVALSMRRVVDPRSFIQDRMFGPRR